MSAPGREAALTALHERGAHFVLCKADKSPITKAYQDPANAPALAKVLAHRGPVGVIPASLGCVVFDVDSGGQEAVDQLVRMMGTPLAQVPSRQEGRSHVWYLHDNPAQVGNARWQHGDIRGGGAGNLILWHPDPLAEAITNAGTPGARIPAKLGDADLARVLETQPAPAAPKGTDFKGADWSPGCRNETLNQLAYQALVNGDEELAHEIKAHALTVGLSQREVEKTWQSAVKAAERRGTRTRIENAWSARGLVSALDAVGVELRWNIRAQRFEYGRAGQWQQATDRHNAWLRQVIQERCSAKKGQSLQPLRYAKDTFNDLRDALGFVNEVDPFIVKLEALPAWDGHPRIDTLLSDLFGAEDTPLVRWASRYAGMAGVQRALEPGCKLDEVPVLLGPQGCGKSAFIRAWLEEHEHDWHGDAVDLAGTEKEQAEQMKGRVLVELSELTGMRKAEIERLKSFITRRNDGQHRGAYARDPEPFLRRVALLGTTNEQEALPQ